MSTDAMLLSKDKKKKKKKTWVYFRIIEFKCHCAPFKDEDTKAKMLKVTDLTEYRLIVFPCITEWGPLQLC